ncbi:MAG: IMP cyclohydrolase [Patescibacteria group bacterium]|nr:IMP cyclohydrolase [Patescibacteria group bacterium]
MENLEANFAKLATSYPGRIVMVALSETGNWRLFSVIAGRSAGSKNRFYKREADLNEHGDFIRTAIYDPNMVKGDPATTLYPAHMQINGWHVASNGEQTYGLAVGLALGAGFRDTHSLYRTEGPQADFTARISVAVKPAIDRAYIGTITRDSRDLTASVYHCFQIGPQNGFPISKGEAYFVSTYNGEGGIEPSLEPPLKFSLRGNLEESMDLIWKQLNPETKVGLAGKEIAKISNRFTYSLRSIYSVY